jgi:N-sulfoglucosamine sulfohydrolase
LAKNEKTNWSEYVFAGGVGSAPFFYYPRRSVRGKRFKLIHNLNYQNENPKVDFYNRREGHFVAGTSLKETAELNEEMTKAYRIWRNPPEYELYDLMNDPNEFKNLSGDEEYKSELEHLKNVLKKWQKDTNDPFADPKKHQLFNEEIKSILKKYKNTAYRNDPDFRWKYVDYFRE